MNDEELAEFIEQVSTDSMETISFGTKEYEEIWEHKETALQWLQSEVEQQVTSKLKTHGNARKTHECVCSWQITGKLEVEEQHGTVFF